MKYDLSDIGATKDNPHDLSDLGERLHDSPSQAPQDAPGLLESGFSAIAAPFRASAEVMRVGERSGPAFMGMPQRQPQSLGERAGDYLGQNAGPMAATIAAQPATLAASGAAALAPYAGPVLGLGIEAGGTGLAAGVGRLAQTGFQNAGSLLGSGAPMVSPSDAFNQAKAEGIATAKGVGVLGGAVKAGRAVIPPIYNYLATSRAFGGIPEASWQYFKDNVDRVLSYVGKGPETADDIANGLRTAVSNSTHELENVYRAGVKNLSQNSREPVRVSTERLVPQIREEINQNFGYLNPERNADTLEAKFFQTRILDRLEKYRYSDATPTQIYEFQKDLNGYIRDHKGTTLGAALQSVKGMVSGFINETPSLRPIAGINSAWAQAKDIESEASKMTNANDLIGYVRRVFANPNSTLQKRAIESVGAQLPEVAGEVANARAFTAAGDLSPLMRSLPATGFSAGLGFGAVKAGTAALTNPLSLLAYGVAPAFSPRAYAYGYKAATSLPRIPAGPLNILGGQAGREALAPYYNSQRTP